MRGFFPTFVTTLLAGTALAERLNDFDVSNASVSTAKILSGGPPRDGIPAIDHPVFIKIGDVDFLSPDDEVLGFSVEGEARAYPLQILVWHEIVNDEIAGHPIRGNLLPAVWYGDGFQPQDGRAHGRLRRFRIALSKRRAYV